MTTQSHAEKHHAREAEISALKVKLRGLEESQRVENVAATALDGEISALAQKASSGDRDALKKQRSLLDRQAEHTLQARNLATLAAVDRAEIARLESTLPTLELSEQLEAVLARGAELPAMSKTLSDQIPAIAQAFGDFRKQWNAMLKASIPLLGEERAKSLARKMELSVDHALRAHLNREFAAYGFNLFGSLEGADFAEVMQGHLTELQSALESKIHTNAQTPSTTGRGLFVAKTNIGGLFGMNLKPGEKISLPLNDPGVLRHIAAGALEQISEKGAAA